MQEMNNAWTAASEEIYKASQAGASNDATQSKASTAPGAENVTDAEFEEVK